MTKQFTDKLDEIFKNNTIAITSFTDEYGDKVTDLDSVMIDVPTARQQILAAIDEAAPTPNPKEWAGNLPQMAWTIGYNQAIADFLKALGIEKGKSPTAQIFITNDLPTLLEKGEE